MPPYSNVAFLTPQILLQSKHAFKNKPSIKCHPIASSDISIILLLTPSCGVNHIKLAGIINSVFDSIPFSSVLLFLWEPHEKSG